MRFWEVMKTPNTDSIRITIDGDAAPVKKEIADLEKQIKKLENKQLPLIGEFEQLQQEVSKAKKAIADADKALSAGKIDKVDHFMITQEATATIENYGAKIEDLRNKIEGLDNQIMPMQERLESLKFTGSPDNSLSETMSQAKSNLEQAANAAGRMGKELSESKAQADGVGKSVGKIGNEAGKSASGLKSRLNSSLKSVESSFSNFGKRISSTLKSALIFSVIYKGLSELKKYMSSALSTNKQFSDSLATLKSNLAVAFQPIFQAILPHLITFVNWLTKAVQWVSALIHVLTGSSVSSSQRAAQELQNSINATKSGASGATAAEKQLTAAIKEKQSQVKALQRENKKLQREYEQQKKAVEAQTDEIEKQISVLEKEIDAIEATEQAMNKAAAAQREAIQANIDILQKKQTAISKERSAVQKEQEQAQKAVNAQKAAIDNQIKAINNQIKALQKRKKAEEKAKKENQKFTADFDELSTLGSVDKEDPLDLDIEKLQEQAELLQEQKEAIEDVDYSARLEALDAENEKLQEQIDMLQEQKEAIKDVDLSAGIASYEAQISSLREKIQELNDSLVENPQIEQNELLIEQLQEEIDLLQEQKDALEESSGAATEFGKLKDTISDINKTIENSKILQWLSDNSDKISDLKDLMLDFAPAILGVYVAFKTFSTILSLASSPAGIFALATSALLLLVYAFGDGEAAVEGLKRMLKGFGEFIKGVFTGDLELAFQGIKDIFGGLKDFAIEVFKAIENAMNNLVILIIEKVALLEEKLLGVKLLEDDVSKKGSPYGYNYNSGGNPFNNNNTNPWQKSSDTYSSDSIPALAQGAVIPPNKPFMAWVGDQRYGTNIEAPLSTIEDAMRNVMAEQEFNFNLNADGSLGAFIRLLKLKLTRESERETAFSEVK